MILKHKVKKTIVLAILDGFGLNDSKYGNAIQHANLINLRAWQKKYSYLKLQASGREVGLPDQQIGNSEVGHLHIGAGQNYLQSLTKINQAISKHQLKDYQTIKDIIHFTKNNNHRLHLIGIFSTGGVHGHLLHIKRLIQIFAPTVKTIFLHLIADGRDTRPDIFYTDIVQLEQELQQTPNVKIATVSGRFYIMDRDKRFDRTIASYLNLLKHTGNNFAKCSEYIKQQYRQKILDEFIEPGFQSRTASKIKKGDALFFTNFRNDRIIQISACFTNKDYFKKNINRSMVKNIFVATMTDYGSLVLPNTICFANELIKLPLGKWLSNNKFRQLRVAETEKIAHVTFFFDGGTDYFKNGLATAAEIKLPYAAIKLVASPQVTTYDLQPKMSADKITNIVVAALKTKKYDFILVNFANCDMVGHTGKWKSTIIALETVDYCLGVINKQIQQSSDILIITADHGNAEMMITKDGNPCKTHTNNRVPFLITNEKINLKNNDDPNIGLSNIAPTIIRLYGKQIPVTMKKKILIKE